MVWILWGRIYLRADHPGNTKYGGVYINSLPWRVLDSHFLQECINFEIIICGKVCSFISQHVSPNLSLEESETFADNLELHFQVTGTKNNRTSYKGTKIDGIV